MSRVSILKYLSHSKFKSYFDSKNEIVGKGGKLSFVRDSLDYPYQ